MSLKDIFKAFPFSKGKTKDKTVLPEPPPPEIPQPSPYAELLEAEMAASISAAPQAPLRIRDVFLLDNLTAKPKSTVGLLFQNPGVAVIRDPYRGSVGRLLPWRLDGVSFALYGDWLGTGIESIGFFHRPSRYFFLWRSDSIGEPEIQFPFGPHDSNWIPLVGDWNGDGLDGVGFYDPDRSVFMLRNQLTAPALPELEFAFGSQGKGWLPVAGDWNGDGVDGIGLFDPATATFYLRDNLSEGPFQHKLRLDRVGPGCLPIAGDWNGDGVDGVGCYDGSNGSFHLRNVLSDGGPEESFKFGPHEIPGTPFSGRWMLPEGSHK